MTKIIKTWIPVAIFAALACSCQNDDPAKTISDPRGEEYAVGPVAVISDSKAEALVGNYIDFACETAASIAHEGGNLVYSPASVYGFIAMLANGADGQTAAQIAEAVGAENTDEIVALCRRQIDSFNRIEAAADAEIANVASAELAEQLAEMKTSASIANAIWVDPKVGTPFSSYVSECQKWLDADMKTLSFGTYDAPRAINKWFADQTNGKITQVVPEVTPIFTEIVCTNALYLNAKWTNAPTKLDEKQPFTNADGSVVTVDALRKTSTLAYARTAEAEMVSLELGLENSPLTFSFILPTNPAANPATVIAPAIVKELDRRSAKTYIDVTFPEYEVETIIGDELRDALIERGMVDAFSAKNANFSRMGNLDFRTVGVAHSAKIRVCESGVEAAAGTANIWVSDNNGPKPTPTELKINRSFAFRIVDNATGMILFLGTVNTLR